MLSIARHAPLGTLDLGERVALRKARGRLPSPPQAPSNKAEEKEQLLVGGSMVHGVFPF